MRDMDADPLLAVAALAEPTRRRLYEHVARSTDPVGRDEAAAAAGVPRATAAFHLDRLVDDGLLDAVFARRGGRTGPGAGRPAKLYRRSGCQVTVSLPERRYDLAGHLLAAALDEADRSGEQPRAVLDRRARELGARIGRAATDGAPGRPTSNRERALRVLEEQGFEPRAEDDGIALANCPFHTLAREHTELVCGMNLHLVEGMLEALAPTGLTGRLCPTTGRCCVRLEPSKNSSG
jgi:predicted ArsR family transcriptional regulator